MAKVTWQARVEPELLERIRNAVPYLAGHPEYLTLTKLANTALEAEVVRLEKKYHKGKPFPDRGE